MAQVVAQQAAFDQHNCQIAAISFGPRYWADVWVQETGFSPLLLDLDRQAYHAYGLKSSWLHAHGAKNLWYYAKAKVKGKKTYGDRGDPNQMGGDFLVGPDGRLRMVHPSKDPTDRPNVEALLAVLAAYHEKSTE